MTKRMKSLVLYLSIFLITVVLFLLNVIEPTALLIVELVLLAAVVSAVIGSIILALVYLFNKLFARKA